MQTQTPVLLSTIKATANNKDRARVWVETDKLAAYGFHRGAPISIEIGQDAITVKLDSFGSRKVAGRVRKGKDIQILDICMPQTQRESIRKDSDRLAVFIAPGMITITAAQ